MPYVLVGLERTYEPWADQEPDSDRVSAVGVWIMALREAPFGVAGSEKAVLSADTFGAAVKDQGVGIGWSVYGDRVAIHMLQDYRTGGEWTWDWGDR